MPEFVTRHDTIPSDFIVKVKVLYTHYVFFFCLSFLHRFFEEVFLCFLSFFAAREKVLYIYLLGDNLIKIIYYAIMALNTFSRQSLHLDTKWLPFRQKFCWMETMKWFKMYEKSWKTALFKFLNIYLYTQFYCFFIEIIINRESF